MGMQYVYPEPSNYGFKDVNGHDGKFFNTNSPNTSHLIIECNDKLTVSLIQNKCEFDYYILEGEGYFTFDGSKQIVKPGDLIVIPPGTKYSFGGKIKMLLINTPHWSQEQEIIIKD
jgi:mannose-6-phosphate isomerase-like protein (cupin superfamily)